MGKDDDSTSYKFDADNEGKLLSITLISGQDTQLIPFDPSSSDYCRFVTWASKNNLSISQQFSTLPPGDYFGKEQDLIEFCKLNGIVLYAYGDKNGRGNLLLKSEVPAPFDDAKIYLRHGRSVPNGINDTLICFCRLHQASPAAQSSWAGSDTEQWLDQPTSVFVSHTLLDQLKNDLSNPDSNIRKLSCWPAEKTFVYVDISDFSKFPPSRQLLILQTLIRITTEDRNWVGVPREAIDDCESSICIGDGYIYVFKNPTRASFFAAYLAALIERLVAMDEIPEFHFRMSVHTGLIYRFWDPSKNEGGRWNYVGRGIIDGQRVLSAIGREKDDIIFVSSQTRNAILRNAGARYDAAEWLQNRGRQSDKHGEFRRVYELNHTGWAQRYLMR